MYRLLENLMLYAPGENSIIGRTALLCEKARSGGTGLKREAYSIVRDILNMASLYGLRGNLWHSTVAAFIALNENPFSLAAERNALTGENVFARSDCDILREIFEYDFTELEKTVGIDCISTISAYEGESRTSDAGKCIEALKDELSVSDDFYETISAFYAEHGVGVIGLNKAFNVKIEQGQAEFIPVREMTDIKLSDLVGYQVQKEKLVGNTEAFLRKRPANNVLLFGDGGTGKSTSIRALANQYSGDGLRIIQVYRHQMQFLTQIITRVKTRNYRFIIYMDDLSFEDFETEYKYLKAVIEGGLEPRPENVLIYATSNRRHLIKETWKDRADMEHDGDMHRSDSIEEKLSLADRFGVQIFYGKPTREEFHHIVEVLAIKEKIDIDSDVLHSEANKWEVRHGGISGRSARQFIDYIKGTEVKYK